MKYLFGILVLTLFATTPHSQKPFAGDRAVARVSQSRQRVVTQIEAGVRKEERQEQMCVSKSARMKKHGRKN